MRDPAGLEEVPLFAPARRQPPAPLRCDPVAQAPSKVQPRPLHTSSPVDSQSISSKANGRAAPERQRDAGRELALDSDGEELPLCPVCGLPTGECEQVQANGEVVLVHGECKAQLVLAAAKKEEEAHAKKDRARKKADREKYGIGWKPQRACDIKSLGRVPSGSPSFKGMCGVALQEDGRSVELAHTSDLAACINLEYLAIAIQVRRCEGREPLFSLDPDYSALKHSSGRDSNWQRKRFEPEWLGGTSVGEVLFQADYHLKELSMGEHAQPIAGMKSCFDMFKEDGNKGQHDSWIAREWFVVRSGEVRISDGNVLTPRVELGVEARELADGPGGVEDAKLTRPDHPLVRYAEAFTHFFDLIAERKSVVHELREVAKACLLAKYLVESEAHLDDRWLLWADEACAYKTVEYPEVPQLWNERRYQQICLADGKMLEAQSESVGNHSVFGVYGGVEMSLDRIELANLMVTAKKSLVVSATIPSEARAPKGVDLNMDKFSVSAPVRAAGEVSAGSWVEAGLLGNAFWTAVEADDGPIDTEDQKLLRGVFRQGLSDRKEEGELFLPPSVCGQAVQRLRELLEEEEAARRRRQEHFCSPAFAVADPGPLFPASWAPSLAISRQDRAAPPGSVGQAAQRKHARPDYLTDAGRLLKSLPAPAFDQRTEDGARFRIYQIGSLEVRTVQQAGGQEAACAVYSSVAAPSQASPDSRVAETERISKVRQYVEKRGKQGERAPGAPPPLRRFYVVLETERGQSILTELLEDGTVRWAVNPKDLEARNSLAKAVCVSDCLGASATVRDAMDFRADQVLSLAGAFSQSASKRFARDMCLRCTRPR